MRVIECDECGETITAASDDELSGRLRAHMLSEHDRELDDDELTELIDGEAYEATDS
jgi:predicted small metal-binding protein